MVTQCIDTLAKPAVQGWLTVWYETEIIDPLSSGPQLAQSGSDGIKNLFWREEGPGLYRLFRGLPDLTVDTGIAAGLGGDIVDTQALPKPSRGDGAECDMMPGRNHVHIIGHVTQPLNGQ